MDKQGLQNAINFLFEPNVILGLELYLILKTADGFELKLADLGDGTLPEEIKNGFIDYLRNKMILNQETEVRPLSELSGLRTTVHHYDLTDIPDGLTTMNMSLVPENIENFNFDNDSLDNLDAFLIKIASADNQVILYKKHSHLNVLKQARVFYLIKDEERFAKPQEGVLRFSFTVDFVKVQNEIFVFDIHCLERYFKFSQIIVNNARIRVTELEELNFVENISELADMISNKSDAKKVLGIRRNSPVLALEFNQIKEFVSNHPVLKKKMRFNDAGTMFKFHTITSKYVFIDIMNDNYLTSDLTSKYYKSNMKDDVKEEHEAQAE